MSLLHYIYKKRIEQHGFNDGNEETGKADILLNITNDLAKATEIQPWFEFEFYKRLEQSIIVSDKQRAEIAKMFNKPADFYLSDLLEKINFADFQKLAALMKIQFTTIKSCEPKAEMFYPLFNHHLLMKLGLETVNHMELESLVDNLASNNADEAFEKGLFLLLQMNFIPFFIGDPETTTQVAEFKDQYFEKRKNLLDHFKPTDPALISKHHCMKFWIIEKGYTQYGETFPEFFKNKEKILGENLSLFNHLSTFFKAHKDKIIYVVNVC